MTKIVITAAGKGTRLLPFSMEMPKEMMPIFSKKLQLKKLFYRYYNLFFSNYIQ